MRIKIGNLVLCSGSGEELPNALAVDGSRNIQPAQFFRGPTSKAYNRKNPQTKITFSVTRLHASHRAALDWDLAHRVAADALDGSEAVTFQPTESSGASSTIWLHYGQLESIVCSPIIGVSTVHTYSLIGGILSASAPT